MNISGKLEYFNQTFHSNHTDEYDIITTQEATIVTGVLVYLMMIVGVGFNLSTILVIISSKDLHNIFMQIIASLCVSDLISAISSPLFWYKQTLGYHEWKLPNALCKIYFGLDYMTSIATALHICTFAIMRYLSIRFPVLFKRLTMRKIAIIIICIWMMGVWFGFISSMFIFEAMEKEADTRWAAHCSFNSERYTYIMDFTIAALAMFLYLPTALIIVTTAMIIITIQKHSRSMFRTNSVSPSTKVIRRRKSKQAILQLLLIVMSFLLGSIPIAVYGFWINTDVQHKPDFRQLDYNFALIQYLLLRISECLNPVFYHIGSRKVRLNTKLFYQRIFTCMKTRINAYI